MMASKTPTSSDSLHDLPTLPYNDAVDAVLSVLHGDRPPRSAQGLRVDDLEIDNASASTSSIFDALLPPILPALPTPPGPSTASAPTSSSSLPNLPALSTVSNTSISAQNDHPFPFNTSSGIETALNELMQITRYPITLPSRRLRPDTSTNDPMSQGPAAKRRRIDPSASRLLQPVTERANQPSSTDSSRVTKRASRRDPMDCPVCLEPAPLTAFIGSRHCNHRVCRPCARRLLISFVSSGSPSLPIRCPHEKCGISWNVNKCLTLLRSFLRHSKTSDSKSSIEKEEENRETTDALNKLTDLQITDRHIRRLAYCSNPKCATPFDWAPSSGACAEDQESRVKCPVCKVESCVDCNTEWHTGKSCFEVSMKATKGEGGFKAMVFNQKWTPCPRCGNAVEKVTGCSHMHCACGCDFCYRCGVESRLHKRGRCSDWRRSGRSMLKS